MTEPAFIHDSAQAARKAADAQAALSRLRHDIARLEGRLAEQVRLELDPVCAGNAAGGDLAQAAEYRQPKSLDGGRLDALLGGGLGMADLHEVRAAETRDGATAAGFVAAMMARLGAAGRGGAGGDATAPIVWISEADRRREAGALYPPGLAALGLDPGRIIAIAAPRTADALWAFEAALACRGVAFAVCEVRRPARCLDLTATRRCVLRAQASGATGFLLRLVEVPEPTAAATRFLIAPAPSAPVMAGVSGSTIDLGGRPAWRVNLEKARTGRTGLVDLEWNADERCFAQPGRRKPQGADPVAVAAAAFDRPADPGRQSAA